MSTDDFVRASDLRDSDPDVPDPTWTPGPAIVAMRDETSGTMTLFEDTDGIELTERWMTIDEEHAVPERETL